MTALIALKNVEKLALESDFMVYAIGMEGPGLTGGLVCGQPTLVFTRD